MSEQGKKDLAMLSESPADWLPGMSQEEKWAKLSEITYTQWMTDFAKVDPDAVKYLSKASSGYWGYGADGIGAIDAWADGIPASTAWGSAGRSPTSTTRRPRSSSGRRNPTSTTSPTAVMASLACWCVSWSPRPCPAARWRTRCSRASTTPVSTNPGNRTRIRLCSPVVKVRNTDDGVEVTYVQNGELRNVKGKGAVMACWYSMLPYIVEDYPDEQKQAAQYMTRIPLVYANTLISNWRAFEKLKIQDVRTVGPGSFWLGFSLDMPVSMGGYEHPSDPDEPILLHWNATPAELGMPPREGVKVGRQDLYKMSFEDMERKMRDLMARTLGSAGFDPAEDIQAITDQPLGARLLVRVRHAVGQGVLPRRSPCPATLPRSRSARSPSPTPTAAPRPTSTRRSTRQCWRRRSSRRRRSPSLPVPGLFGGRGGRRHDAARPARLRA